MTIKLIKMIAETASQENIAIMVYERRKKEKETLPTTFAIYF